MLASTIIGAGSTMLGAVAQSNQMQAQASAAQQQADIEGEWNKRRSLEELGAAQREASNRLRETKLAQSALVARAGGSNAGQDGTVMNLWGDIEKEGRLNAQNTFAQGEQAVAGANFQSDLNRWSTDANAKIAKSGARATLLGGALSSTSQAMGGFAQSRMAAKYGQPQSSSYRYGS